MWVARAYDVLYTLFLFYFPEINTHISFQVHSSSHSWKFYELGSILAELNSWNCSSLVHNKLKCFQHHDEMFETIFIFMRLWITNLFMCCPFYSSLFCWSHTLCERYINMAIVGRQMHHHSDCREAYASLERWSENRCVIKVIRRRVPFGWGLSNRFNHCSVIVHSIMTGYIYPIKLNLYRRPIVPLVAMGGPSQRLIVCYHCQFAYLASTNETLIFSWI